MSLTDRQMALGKYLMTHGTPWPAVSAAASVGNATQENMCNPITTGPKDHGSDGLYQWRAERLTGSQGLQPWCVSRGYDWRLMESQAEFHKWEMQTQYPGLWQDMIEGKKPIATLTANIMDQYERPAAEFAALDARIKYAKDTFSLLVGSAPIPTPIPTPIPSPTVPTGEDMEVLMKELADAKARRDAAKAAYTAADNEVQSLKAKLLDIINRS